ncbi:MAG: ADP-ribosylglycohydrolase family protein, partial [Snowella sp.]
MAQTNPREFPVALIPTALFRHDYLTGFQDELGILRENQLISPDDALALLGWSQVLSLIVREKFPSKNKVEFCLSSLQAVTQGTVGEESLIGIKRAIQEGYSLERVVETLGASELLSAIALSLYFFLDTPEHFDLTLKRAALIKHPLVLPFTGALAGAYHGFTSIPLLWRLTQPEPIFSERIHQFWGQWSGVLSENSLPLAIAIASPLVIQARPN